VFQPSDRLFRSLPLTPKPRIYGIHTAKVVGKKGEDTCCHVADPRGGHIADQHRHGARGKNGAADMGDDAGHHWAHMHIAKAGLGRHWQILFGLGVLILSDVNRAVHTLRDPRGPADLAG
jgi:uncharacterized protein involved in type VI secretion and phage assembly